MFQCDSLVHVANTFGGFDQRSSGIEYHAAGHAQEDSGRLAEATKLAGNSRLASDGYS